MKKNLVSIIVLTYNHELFINQSLKSIINQSYKYWEAIIIDDGSTDNTIKLIKKITKSDKRFRLFSQENKGIFNLDKNYNKALHFCKNELIAVLEGDDFWPNDKLQKQVECFMKNEKIGLVWGGGTEYYSRNKKVYVKGYDFNYNYKILHNIKIGSIFKHIVFNRLMNMPSCSVMYRKSALLDIGGFYQPKFCEWLDRPTWALLALTHQFYYIDENLCYYRKHPKQITHNYRLRSQKFTFELCLQDENCPVLLKSELNKLGFYIFFYSSLRRIKLFTLTALKKLFS